MDFSDFSNKARKIEKEDSQNRKTEIIADMFLNAGTDLGVTTRFIRGEIFPAWDDSNLNVGPSILYEAVADAVDKEADEVEDLVAEYGGISGAISAVDFDFNSGQQNLSSFSSDSGVSVGNVYDVFEKISNISGSGSQEKKRRLLSNIILDCGSKVEVKYFSRIVLGEMRIGVGDSLVRDAISDAFDVSNDVIQKGIMVTNDTGLVAEKARDLGEDGVSSLQIELKRPVSPMLATDGELDEIMEKVSNNDGEVAVEPKYDGARLQIHVDGDDVRLYSRKLNEETKSLPDVVEIVKENVDTDSAIIDTEVVAYEDGEPLPFQNVMNRFGRKHNIEEKAEEIQIKVYAFDLIYLDGEEKIDESYTERRQALLDICDDEIVTQSHITNSEDKVKEIQQQSLADGNEGIVIKSPESKYIPSDRGWNWAKLKPETETIDCMVVGGEWGEGNRAGQFGSFLLAVKNEDTGELDTIGKVATGITEYKLEKLTERFKSLITEENGKDVKFKPKVVFEIGVEEIQPSPKYTSGYGIRFPRFIAVREDKSYKNIDTVERIERLKEKT